MLEAHVFSWVGRAIFVGDDAASSRWQLTTSGVQLLKPIVRLANLFKPVVGTNLEDLDTYQLFLCLEEGG